MTAIGKTQWTLGKDLPSMALINESSGSFDEAPIDELGVSSGWPKRTPSVEAQRHKKRADGPSSGSEVTVKPHADSNNATIANCLQLLANILGIDPLSPLYLLGTQLITIPANREVFMGLPNDDVCLAWLQLHIDEAAGTAPTFSCTLP
ncbi:L10-interacting MYB domain-containing protein [Actinidia chinensis var. chinensis]|uniref:L10-interacting MYB domain-containing protein n=1 Tax=Actinidia chinensis var. chinensis TaxID=1590841 RepID=A0A2R6S177_ACTCC|nr:L10-interacting MYB domain-containing protein [Actinidia chinensis var. chinensis]